MGVHMQGSAFGMTREDFVDSLTHDFDFIYHVLRRVLVGRDLGLSIYVTRFVVFRATDVDDVDVVGVDEFLLDPDHHSSLTSWLRFGFDQL